MTTTNPIRSPYARLAVAAAMGSAALAAATPENWSIDLVCRSSLDPGIPAFRLPQFSSLSSQYVSLDEQGRVAIRVVLDTPDATEGIFVGDSDGGGLVLTANDPSDPVWSLDLDIRNNRFVLADATFGPGGAGVYGLNGNLLQRFDVGLIGVDGSVQLADDGAIGYRGAVGLAGTAVVLDEFIDGDRVQTQALSTLDGEVDFIFSPAMNGDRRFVANTLPVSGPSRRILRLAPDGAGGYTSETIAETGGEFNAFVNSTAISEDGRVAFSARRSNDSVWQVSRRDDPGSPIVPIARGGDMGIVNSNLANFPPVVNSSGLVAFRVEDAAGSTALFAGDGEELVRVLGFGDTVETDLGELAVGFDFGGDIGVQVMNGVVDINDNDQIAFAAFLENGTIGVFVATPEDGGCNAADIAAPFGVLDLTDLQAFVSAFLLQEPIADIAPPAGVWDLNDVQAFVAEFNAGCP